MAKGSVTAVADVWRSPNLRPEAQRRAVSFIRRLLPVIGRVRFDVMIAAGNTGVMMACIAGQAYRSLGIPAPRIVRIPVYLRDGNGKRVRFDNSVLVPEVRKQIRGMNSIRNVLFVDDELNARSPRTLMASCGLLRRAYGTDAGDWNVYAFAELDRSKARWRRIGSLRCTIRYFPFAAPSKRWKGVTNFVSYNLPWRLESEVRKYYSDRELNSTEVFNTLLGEPVRVKGELRDGRPFFTYRYVAALKRKAAGFDRLQGALSRHINDMVLAARRGKPGHEYRP